MIEEKLKFLESDEFSDEFRESVQSFLENPYWERYFNEAPSDDCRKYIAYEFYLSDIDEDDEEAEEKAELAEAALDIDDWKYLYEHCSNNPRKSYIKQMIRRLSM